MTLTHYLVLASILFCIGLFGALSKRNAIMILMCIEIMLSGVNITLVAFSRFMVAGQVLLTGQVFAMFVMVVEIGRAHV